MKHLKASLERKKTSSMGGSLQKTKSYCSLGHLLTISSAHLFASVKFDFSMGHPG